MKDNSAINGVIIKVITGEELTSTESTMYKAFIADEGNREMIENLQNDENKLRRLIEFHRIDLEGGRVIIEQELDSERQVSIKRPESYFGM